MDYKYRTKKDLEKLLRIIEVSKTHTPKHIMDYVINYYQDAIFYYEKGDYFTAFGCANYAYGILERYYLETKKSPFHDLYKSN